jgi:hypothetical protein
MWTKIELAVTILIVITVRYFNLLNTLGQSESRQVTKLSQVDCQVKLLSCGSFGRFEFFSLSIFCMDCFDQ